MKDAKWIVTMVIRIDYYMWSVPCMVETPYCCINFFWSKLPKINAYVNFFKKLFLLYSNKINLKKATLLEQVTLTQTITKVEGLIDTGKGDSGRFNHILEFLKNNRPIYQSDQIYLENILNSTFSVEEGPMLENNSKKKKRSMNPKKRNVKRWNYKSK